MLNVLHHKCGQLNFCKVKPTTLTAKLGSGVNIVIAVVASIMTLLLAILAWLVVAW